MIRLLVAGCVCWSLTLWVQAEEVARQPGRAVGNLQLAEGLEAKLFAAEPQLHSPTNIAVDAQGRVWVCEVTNYRGHASARPRVSGDRILIFTDQDGDGRSDRTHVFYQGRDIDSAQGIAVLGHRVIVTAPPNVFVLIDEDGDDRADRREVLFRQTGKGQDDHSTHAFVFGPDGRFYWNMGNHGFAVHDRDGNLVRDRHGWPVATRDAHRQFPHVPLATTPWQGGLVLRCETDGSGVEVLGHNFRNNYELAVDAFGNVWQADNDDDGNRGCRVNYILPYGNYGYRAELSGAHWRQRRVGQHQDLVHRHWHQNDPGVVPNVAHTGAGAPAGITVYEGSLLPAAFHGQPLVCDAGAGTLRLVQTRASGAGYGATVVDVMRTTSDRWVRPADVAVAPDGAVFVSDWYDPVLGWNRQADRDRGRIFRVAPRGYRSDTTWSTPKTIPSAIDALSSPNADRRFQAWQHLVRARDDAESALVHVLHATSASATLRARVLWILARLGSGAEHLRWAMKQEDASLRLVAVRAAVQRGEMLDELLSQVVDDPDPHVRAECAVHLSWLPVDEAVPLWVSLAAHHDGQDRWYLEALGIGARSRWDACLAAYARRFAASALTSTAAGRDLVWRSRSQWTPQWLTKVMTTLPVAGLPHRYLRALEFQPDSPARDAAWRAIYQHWVRKIHPERDRVLAHVLLKLPLESWDDDPASVRELVGTLHGQPGFVELAQKFGVPHFRGQLWEFAATQPDTGLAAQALAALLEEGSVADIRQRLRDVSSTEVSRWMQLLGATLRADAEDLLLTELVSDQVDGTIQRAAVRALAGTNSGAAKLLEMAESGELSPSLAEEAGRTLARSLNVVLRNRAAALLPMPRAKGSRALPQMTELLTYLGDAERGKRVFVAATCAKCHRIGGEGEEFGPDLSEIGDKLSKRGLYEAILDPSSGIAKGYEHYVLVTREGLSFSALKLTETSAELTVRIQGAGIRTIPRGDVEEFTLQEQSVMPADLMQLMTVNDLVDLVTYLGTQRKSTDPRREDLP